MNPLILNRDFTHPTDGWYQIEAKGEHPNIAAGVIQVIDDESAQSIVNRFNADAKAGTLRHGKEMLIDHEHFSDQPDKETRAYGWLTQLQNREDGIYGQIRWTKTGKDAVDGGDYRFFSTEYDPQDLQPVNNRAAKEFRPLRLDGLTLTNMNNNRGQKPITNRILNGDVAGHDFHGNQYTSVETSIREDAGYRRSKNLGDGVREHYIAVNATAPRIAAQRILSRAKAAGASPRSRIAESNENSARVVLHDEKGGVHQVRIIKGYDQGMRNRGDFADASASAASETKTKNRTNTMNSIAQKLGLAAEASEESILAEVTRLLNRVTELLPHEEENKTLKNRLTQMDGDQVDGLLDLYQVKEEKIRNRLKPVLAGLKNREERVATLADFGFKLEAKNEKGGSRLLNRGDGKNSNQDTNGLNEQQLAQQAEREVQDYKIRNRCSYADARNAVRNSKPELFGLSKQ